MQAVEFILYVRNQENSCDFYEKLLRKKPVLHVPGMTEFLLAENCKLGLMPNSGIVKILGNRLPSPEIGNGIPRCELYFEVDDVAFEFKHALESGATLVSELADRDWGHRVCYFADPDGHVIAFAQKIKE